MGRYVSLEDCDGAARVLLPVDTYVRYGNIESDLDIDHPVHSFTGPPRAWCQRIRRHWNDRSIVLWERD